jgi:hypothetical protein
LETILKLAKNSGNDGGGISFLAVAGFLRAPLKFKCNGGKGAAFRRI